MFIATTPIAVDLGFGLLILITPTPVSFIFSGS